MFQRAKTIDYESQPYPHDLPPGYSQTILLPITIRSNSNDTTPESSGYNTPRNIEEIEDDEKYRTRSAMITSSERMVEDERKAYSADGKRENLEYPPSGKQCNDSSIKLPRLEFIINFWF